jgi:hypothetical protein
MPIAGMKQGKPGNKGEKKLGKQIWHSSAISPLDSI